MVTVPTDDQNSGVQTPGQATGDVPPDGQVAEKTPEAEDNPVADDQTVALTQKKIYKEKSPYSDQQLSSSLANFNSAINSVMSFFNQAQALENKTSDKPVHKINNYYLTADQKALLLKRAVEFAQPGIVPYDVIKEFLYCLVYIDDYQTLKYVATATEIPSLDNPNLVREPTDLLNAKDLYKVGYMANGLAALTKKIDSKNFPQGTSASDNNKSAYSALFNAANGLTEAAQTISQFPGVGIFGQVMSQITSLQSTVKGMTSTFESPGQTKTKVEKLTEVNKQVQTLQDTMKKSIDVAKQHNVKDLKPLATKMEETIKKSDPIKHASDMMKDVKTDDNYPKEKVDDLNIQLKSIFDDLNHLSGLLGNVQSMLGAIKGPGNIGQSASTLLTMPTARTTSQKVTEMALGQAVPPNILANNPMSIAASYVGRAFFGEGRIPVAATDQMFSRLIGNFPSPSNAAGVSSFQMQNFASMGGQMSMSQLLMQVVYGVMSVESGSPFAQLIEQHAADIGNLLGASPLTTAVEPRRSDHAIPMMIGIATVLTNDAGCPVDTKHFSDGWKLAASVGNDLQSSRPDYLKAIQTHA